MRLKEKDRKLGLKLNIPKTKILASGPINSCQIEGEILEADFISLASKITSPWTVTEAMKFKKMKN